MSDGDYYSLADFKGSEIWMQYPWMSHEYPSFSSRNSWCWFLPEIKHFTLEQHFNSQHGFSLPTWRNGISQPWTHWELSWGWPQRWSFARLSWSSQMRFGWEFFFPEQVIINHRVGWNCVLLCASPLTWKHIPHLIHLIMVYRACNHS